MIKDAVEDAKRNAQLNSKDTFLWYKFYSIGLSRYK
jgi:hypothetical protein